MRISLALRGLLESCDEDRRWRQDISSLLVLRTMRLATVGAVSAAVLSDLIICTAGSIGEAGGGSAARIVRVKSLDCEACLLNIFPPSRFIDCFLRSIFFSGISYRGSYVGSTNSPRLVGCTVSDDPALE